MRRFIISLFCLILFLPACGQRAKPPQAAMPLNELYKPLSLKMLPMAADNESALSAEMRLIIDAKGSPTVRLKGFMLLKTPASLRLEVDGAIGSGTAITCNGEHMDVLNSHERTYNRYPADNISFSGILPLPLSCRDILAVLQGELPTKIKDTKISYDEHQGQISLTFKYKGYYWRAILIPGEKPPARLMALELRENRRSEPLFTVTLDDYSEVFGRSLPGKWLFDSPRDSFKTTLKLYDYEAGAPTDDLFELKRPKGYK